MCIMCYCESTCNTTVTLPKPTVARRSVSKKWENRATSADCRPTSAPIFADFLVGRQLFCRSTQVKSFVDRSADFQAFCHRWGVGRWSPDDRPTVGRLFEEIYIMIIGVNRPLIARRSVDDILSKNRRQTDAGYRPSFGRWSPDCRPIINVHLFYIVHNACSALFMKLVIMHLFYFGIYFIGLRVYTSNIWFCNRFPIELFVWRVEINVISSPKILQPYPEHSHIYENCNLKLKILL